VIDATSPPRVVLITDPRYSRSHVASVIDAAAAALRSRASLLVQLRDKDASPTDLREHAEELRRVTERARVGFVINAKARALVDVAIDTGADGVHVPCSLKAMGYVQDAWTRGMPWISVPAHTDGDVALAVRGHATAALVSPIWETEGKGPPRGTPAIDAALATRGDAALLVYALGGVVTGDQALAAATAGADGVAVIRALLGEQQASKNAYEEVAAMARLLEAPFVAMR